MKTIRLEIGVQPDGTLTGQSVPFDFGERTDLIRYLLDSLCRESSGPLYEGLDSIRDNLDALLLRNPDLPKLPPN